MTLFAPATEFYKAKNALLEALPGIDLLIDEIAFVPQAQTSISQDELPMLEKFLSMLNDCDDVQDVYHNAKLPQS